MPAPSQPPRRTSPSPRCDRPVQGDGIMSYHCSLPQGHETQTLDQSDPQPCYSVESNRSARIWQNWSQRDHTRRTSPVSLSMMVDCPACHEPSMRVTGGGGSCEECGATAEIQQEAAHAPPDAPEVSPTKQREGDQQLPKGGQECVQDIVIEAMEESKRVGMERYGSHLMTFNSRKGLQDFVEEARDLFVYGTMLQREAEATRDTLVEVVSKTLSRGQEMELGEASLAESVVDSVMGWVSGQQAGVIDDNDQEVEGTSD